MPRATRNLTLPSLLFWVLAMQQSHAQLPFEREPIKYSKTEASDPVARLRTKIETGQLSLERSDKYGYLLSLLGALEIPASSQTLVFSKSSLQRHRISPSNPREIYFNDEIYIGWIPDGELIEIASIDSMLGSVFYTVEQDRPENQSALERHNDQCLFCHGSSDTGRVPGLLMQSVYTDSDGNRVFPSESIRPSSKGPLLGRWGGWFVTGTHGVQRHLGNLMVRSDATVTADDLAASANVVDLSNWFDVDKYLSPHSDIVALLVLQHQVSMHNLLTSVNHRARARLHTAADRNRSQGLEGGSLLAEDLVYLDAVAEEAVDGLLRVGQPTLSQRITGTSPFAEEFSARGPFDSAGRGLRQLDLQTSLFEFPCSYLIYTDSFDALPEPLLSPIFQRLGDVLESRDTRDKYAHVSAADRSAIAQILRETKTNLPEGRRQ